MTNLVEIHKRLRIFFNLAFDDFRARYGNTVLGVLWLFINPLLTVLVFWFVFRVGFRVGAPRPEIPFVVWFSAGLVPWLCFSEALGGASNSVMQYSYLLRKQAFPIGIIPGIKVATAFFAHLIFLLVLVAVMVLTNTPFSTNIVMLPYYMLCLVLASAGVGYFSATITPFIRDWSQVIGVVLQFGAWLTPVMWPWTMLPVEYRWALYINPLAYVVEGYRMCLFGGTVLENVADPMTIYPPYMWASFWGIAILMLWCGAAIFRRLRSHFADIL